MKPLSYRDNAVGTFYWLLGTAGVLFGGVAVLAGTFAGEIVPYIKSRRSKEAN